MWFAERAKINVGVITCIWSLNPLFMAIFDWILFDVKLKYFHIIGTIALVIAVLSISFNEHFSPIFMMSYNSF